MNSISTAGSLNGHVTNYTLEYRSSGVTWTSYGYADGETKVFDNFDIALYDIT